MARKKKREKSFEERMEAFGRRMESRRRKEKDHSGLGFGLFLLLVGIVWMGNDLGWWQPSLPLWPTILVVFGATVFLSELLKLLRR